MVHASAVGDSAVRRHLTKGKIFGLGIGIALVCLAVLWWVGHRAVDQVTAAAGIPDCDETGGAVYTDFDDEDFRRPAIRLSKEFDCTLAIKVDNGSRRDVDLRRVTVPFGGAEGSAAYRVTHLGDGAVPDRSDVDATTDLDDTLAPGESTVVWMRMVFRQSGCTSPSGFMLITPTVEVSDLFVSRTLAIPDFPALLGTAASSCDG